MGEIAEMMLDGTLCAGCGEFIGEATEHPRFCSAQCAKDHEREPGAKVHSLRANNADKAQRINIERERAAGGFKRFACPSCSKRFRYATALAQHERDKHSPLTSHVGREP